MNYNILETQIQNYANKADTNFLTAIPTFIEMGQQRIWRELTGIEFEQRNETGSFYKGSIEVAKPADWNKTISFSYTDDKNIYSTFKSLKLRTYEFCRAYWPNANTDVAPPEFYSDLYTEADGSFFFISPTPDKDYQYELIYLKRIDSISKNKGTNVLTDNYPDLLFYACFLEALAYLRDDDRIQIYEANYQRALASAQAKTADRHLDRTTNREID